MPFTQMLFQWVSENAEKIIAVLAMGSAMVVSIRSIFRHEQARNERDRADIEHDRSMQIKALQLMMEERLHPMLQWEPENITYMGGRGGGGMTTTRPLISLRNTITSGSCAMSVYPQSEESLAYRRRVEGSWEPIKVVEPEKPREPLRLFCSSCNGYTYSDSHGNCINCGHVREKVIEPIYSKERT